MAFKTNVEDDSLENEFYRKVIFTGKHMQLVLMSLKAGEDIPLETHEGIEQFIRVESGEAYVKIGNEEFNLADGDVVIIPENTEHYVKNSGDDELKLYTIYAVPEHKDGVIHETRDDAIKAHESE